MDERDQDAINLSIEEEEQNSDALCQETQWIQGTSPIQQNKEQKEVIQEQSRHEIITQPGYFQHPQIQTQIENTTEFQNNPQKQVEIQEKQQRQKLIAQIFNESKDNQVEEQKRKLQQQNVSYSVSTVRQKNIILMIGQFLNNKYEKNQQVFEAKSLQFLKKQAKSRGIQFQSASQTQQNFRDKNLDIQISQQIKSNNLKKKTKNVQKNKKEFDLLSNIQAKINEIEDYDQMLKFCQSIISNQRNIFDQKEEQKSLFQELLRAYFGQKITRTFPIYKKFIVQLPSQIKHVQRQIKNRQNKIQTQTQNQEKYDCYESSLKNSQILLCDKLGNIYYIQNGKIAGKNKQILKKSNKKKDRRQNNRRRNQNNLQEMNQQDANQSQEQQESHYSPTSSYRRSKKILTMKWINQNQFVLVQDSSLIKIFDKNSLDNDEKYEVVSIGNKKINFALVEVQNSQINEYFLNERQKKDCKKRRKIYSMDESQTQSQIQNSLYIKILTQIENPNEGLFYFTIIRYMQYKLQRQVQKTQFNIIYQKEIATNLNQKFDELFFFKLKQFKINRQDYIELEESCQKIIQKQLKSAFQTKENSQEGKTILGLTQDHQKIRIIQYSGKIGSLYRCKENQYINKVKIVKEKIPIKKLDLNKEYQLKSQILISERDFIYAVMTEYEDKIDCFKSKNRVVKRNILKLNYYGDVLQIFPLNFIEGNRKKQGKVSQNKNKSKKSNKSDISVCKNQLKVQDFFVCLQQKLIVLCTKQNIVFYSMINKIVLFTIQTEQIDNSQLKRFLQFDDKLCDLGYCKGNFFQVISTKEEQAKKILLQKKSKSIFSIGINRIPRNFLVLMREIGRNHPQIFQLNIF